MTSSTPRHDKGREISVIPQCEAMAQFIVLAAMKGQFVSAAGNMYDNFQMLGYVDAGDPTGAVTAFFDQTPYPIQWVDVDYLWAEQLMEGPHTGHHGDYDRVYVESLRRRWDPPGNAEAKDYTNSG